MAKQAVKVGAVDIGTNSMRLLITDGESSEVRLARVTGLGVGVDSTGTLSEPALVRTVAVLADYGRIMQEHHVGPRCAIATSASRDAANREDFFDRVEEALGVRPEVISGEEEARLAFEGATTGLDPAPGTIVSDIGGGSTELVSSEWSRSVNIGSIRLSERVLLDRPPGPIQMEAARQVVADRFSEFGTAAAGALIGVAGTWTSLAGIVLGLDEYRDSEVHGALISRVGLESAVERLSTLSLEETERIPALDPDRAPVILAGAVIASGVVTSLEIGEVLISERDSLDAIASELLALL